ncbi:Ig-like domain-containing protein, partial [Zhengella sp. ZM62]|uniref:Ig-like domain-containing protein n=1 Tax=Zhengella sedimenti TaxID=3390035 RepID=UPI003974E5D2
APLEPTGVTATPNDDGTLSVTGSGEPGSEVTVTFPDGSTGTATVNPDGTWGPVTSTAPQTSGDVTASQEDEAGNVSGETGFFVLVPPLGSGPGSSLPELPSGEQSGGTGTAGTGAGEDVRRAFSNEGTIAGTLRWIDNLGSDERGTGHPAGFEASGLSGGGLSISLGDGSQGAEITTFGRDGRTYLTVGLDGSGSVEWSVTGPGGGGLPAWVVRQSDEQVLILWPADEADVALEIRIRKGDGTEAVIPVSVDRVSGEVIQTGATQLVLDASAAVEDRLTFLSNRAANETARLLQALKE